MNPQEQSNTLSGTAARGRSNLRMGISLGEIRWRAAGVE
jgi:hypothetical protein